VLGGLKQNLKIGRLKKYLDALPTGDLPAVDLKPSPPLVDQIKPRLEFLKTKQEENHDKLSKFDKQREKYNETSQETIDKIEKLFKKYTLKCSPPPHPLQITFVDEEGEFLNKINEMSKSIKPLSLRITEIIRRITAEISKPSEDIAIIKAIVNECEEVEQKVSEILGFSGSFKIRLEEHDKLITYLENHIKTCEDAKALEAQAAQHKLDDELEKNKKKLEAQELAARLGKAASDAKAAEKAKAAEDAKTTAQAKAAALAKVLTDAAAAAAASKTNSIRSNDHDLQMQRQSEMAAEAAAAAAKHNLDRVADSLKSEVNKKPRKILAPQSSSIQGSPSSPISISGPTTPVASPTSEPVPKPEPPKRYSIFIPTPRITKKIYRQGEKDQEIEEEDVEPTTILEVVVDKEESAAADGSGADGGGARITVYGGQGGGGRNANHGHDIIQRGGAGHTIYKVTRLTPKVIELLSSFKPANEVLTPEFFTEVTTGLEPMKSDSVEQEYRKIEEKLIESIDRTDYFNGLGQKASWKTTIMKLVENLDKSKLRPIKTSYKEMYDKLWTFMERDSGCISTLRSIFSSKNINGTSLETTLLGGIGQQPKIHKRIGWSSKNENNLLDRLFDGFSMCIDEKDVATGQQATFLKDRTVSNNQSVRYRFMLNWIILVAFNISYDSEENIYFYVDENGTKKEVSPKKPKTQPLIDLCELIEHLYKTFLGWMIPMSAESLLGEFTNIKGGSAETYLTNTQKRIDDKTDETLKYLRKAIQRKLCELGPTEDRPQIAGQQFLKKGHGAASGAVAHSEMGAPMTPRPASPRPASPRPASTLPLSQPLLALGPASKSKSRVEAATIKPPPPPASTKLAWSSPASSSSTPPPQSPRPPRPPAQVSQPTRPNRSVTTTPLFQSASKEESSKLLQQMGEYRGDSGARSPAFENRGDSGARSTDDNLDVLVSADENENDHGDADVSKPNKDHRKLEEFTKKLEDPKSTVRQLTESNIHRKRLKEAVKNISSEFPSVNPDIRSSLVSRSGATVGQFNRKGNGSRGGKPRTRKRTRPSIIIHRHKTRRIAPKSVSLDKKYTRRNKNHKRTEQRSKTE
jgi:hypothetical protein